MGKYKGKKPQRPEKDKDNPPTEAQLRDREATNARAARKTATRLLHTFVPRRPHHCGECFGVTDFNTCVKKGHQVWCEAHKEWHSRKSHCVKCVQKEEREATRERDEREAQKERDAKDKAKKEDWCKAQDGRKKPGTKKH